MNQALFVLTIALRTIGMILAIVFAARYSRDQWRSTPEGRHLMWFSLIVAGFLAYATANNIAAWVDDYVPPGIVDGNYPGRLELGAIFYGWMAWAMWQRNRLLTRAHRQRDHD